MWGFSRVLWTPLEVSLRRGRVKCRARKQPMLFPLPSSACRDVAARTCSGSTSPITLRPLALAGGGARWRSPTALLLLPAAYRHRRTQLQKLGDLGAAVVLQVKMKTSSLVQTPACDATSCVVTVCGCCSRICGKLAPYRVPRFAFPPSRRGDKGWVNSPNCTTLHTAHKN
jgi:hypothetical protein